MKTNTFDSVQQAALDNFEDALSENARGCIGHVRKTNNKRRVVACYRRVAALGITDALTDSETRQARECAGWLGENLEDAS